MSDRGGAATDSPEEHHLVATRPARSDELPELSGDTGSKRGVLLELDSLYRFCIRVLVIGAVLYCVGLVLREISSAVIPFIFSLFVTAALHPVVNWLARRGAPRLVGSMLSLTIALAVIVTGLVFFIVGFVREARNLGEQLVSGGSRFMQLVSKRIPGLSSQEGTTVLEQVGTWFADHAQKAFMQGASLTVSIITGVGFALFFSFFFLKEGKSLRERCLSLLSQERSVQVAEALNAVWESIGAYVRGIATVAVFNAGMTGLAMWALGLPMVGSVMVLTFFGSFIPFAGPLIAITLASLIALGNDGLSSALIMVGAGCAIQAIEGNILQPWIVGDAVKIHPVVVLFAVTAGTSLLGIVGAFLAVPTVASVHSAWTRLTESSKGLDDPKGLRETSSSV